VLKTTSIWWSGIPTGRWQEAKRARGPKLPYRIETREDRAPADAVVRVAVDVRGARGTIDRDARNSGEPLSFSKSGRNHSRNAALSFARTIRTDSRLYCARMIRASSIIAGRPKISARETVTPTSKIGGLPTAHSLSGIQAVMGRYR
jgi:hypothetical protein